MANITITKFKEGDIIKPIEGAKSSNYRTLHSIKKAQVKRIFTSPHSKSFMDILILEGHSDNRNNYQRYYIGDTISVYDNAFEILVPEEEDYDVY